MVAGLRISGRAPEGCHDLGPLRQIDLTLGSRWADRRCRRRSPVSQASNCLPSRRQRIFGRALGRFGLATDHLVDAELVSPSVFPTGRCWPHDVVPRGAGLPPLALARVRALVGRHRADAAPGSAHSWSHIAGRSVA